jgi:predicted metal-dependent hydrolase
VKVEIVRSPRRRKTVQAREVNGILRVSIPATMTKADEDRWVAEMVRRMERRSFSAAIDLSVRARELAKRHDLSRPGSIRWSDNQEWRWGSCTPATGAIRISSRLAREPGWVVDYVIVHELAHLDVARHDRQFWAIVNRYPLAERARGFLIARSAEPGRPEPAGEDDSRDVVDEEPDALVAPATPIRNPTARAPQPRRAGTRRS